MMMISVINNSTTAKKIIYNHNNYINKLRYKESVKGVNYPSKDVTDMNAMKNTTRFGNFHRIRGCAFVGAYVPWIYSHARCYCKRLGSLLLRSCDVFCN